MNHWIPNPAASRENANLRKELLCAFAFVLVGCSAIFGEAYAASAIMIGFLALGSLWSLYRDARQRCEGGAHGSRLREHGGFGRPLLLPDHRADLRRRNRELAYAVGRMHARADGHNDHLL